jgi:hypothetical protein
MAVVGNSLNSRKLGVGGGPPEVFHENHGVGACSTFFWSRSVVELLELGVFGWKNLERSVFFGSGAAWSYAKHALSLFQRITQRISRESLFSENLFVSSCWNQ